MTGTAGDGSANHAERRVPAGRLWYVRRGATVKGPFAAEAVRRYLVLGRVRRDDELSVDQERWSTVSDLPMFAGDGQDQHPAPALAGLREDERSGFDRRAAGPESGRPRGPDRRRDEAAGTIAMRQRRSRRLPGLGPEGQGDRRAVWVVAVLLVLVAALAIIGRGRDPAATAPDCLAAPAPGVNWRGCALAGRGLAGAALAGADLGSVDAVGVNLTGADLRGASLAYADFGAALLGQAGLAAADLRGARLAGASLAGADLRQADLRWADLRAASLGGARLEGARLDGALWLDGRRCEADSLGTCR